MSTSRWRWMVGLLLCLAIASSAGAPAHASETSGLDRDVANLVAFARLYGLVRWFHPSDEAFRADWDQLAIDGVCALRETAGPEALAQALNHFFSGVAPSARVFQTAEPIAAPEIPIPDTSSSLHVISWEHSGIGTVFSRTTTGSYSSTRIRDWFVKGQLLPGVLDPQNPLQLALDDTLSVWLPVALYADIHGTFPRVDLQNEAVPPVATPDKEALLLADAIVIWNVMQHFYPYFDLVDVDWRGILEQTLRNILAEGSGYSVTDMKEDLLVPLHDGHAWIRPFEGGAVPALNIARIDSELVVTACGDSALAKVRPGDVIRSIDGAEAEAIFQDLRRGICGSDQHRDRMACLLLLLGEEGTSVDLLVESPLSQRTRSISLNRTDPYNKLQRSMPIVSEIEPGILYVDVTRASDDLLLEAQTLISRAQGIVIDARGYIGCLWSRVFARETLRSMDLRTYKTSLPDQMSIVAPRSVGHIVPLNLVQPDCELVFLVNGNAISAAEHQLSYFVAAGIGTTVGTPTAGANGNVNILRLPSGREVAWTGMRAEWADGSQFHALGIEPDILVPITRDGLAAGRDELLDAALEFLRNTLVPGESD